MIVIRAWDNRNIRSEATALRGPGPGGELTLTLETRILSSLRLDKVALPGCPPLSVQPLPETLSEQRHKRVEVGGGG